MKDALSNIANMAVSRRTVLKIAGGLTLAITFFPRVALAGRNSIKSLRTGLQPGNKTRLVVETSSRPSYTLSYLTEPNRLVVNLTNTIADNSIKTSLASGTLVKSLTQEQSGDKLKIIATLSKSISEIPKNNILMLEPTGDTDYRLVLDFVAGSNAAAAAATSSSSENSEAKKNTRKPIIVLDPGHGGKDPGCTGKAGVKEKNIVLKVARKLRDKLKQAGYNVYMTRDKDIFLNLGTRADIAEKKKADLFISLHANANPRESMKGFSVYTLSKKASDEEAQKLADAENAADKIEVDGFEKFEPDIRNALSSLQQHAVAAASVEIASDIQKSFSSKGIREQSKGVLRSAPFAVLRSTTPSALVELGHLSNRTEEKLLNSDNHQTKLAMALVNAVNKYDFE